MHARDDIERLLHPRGVAVVGPVSRTVEPRAFLAPIAERFGERFHLVDRRGGTVGDHRVYPTVAELPDPVDLAVLNVPREEVAGMAEECGRRGVPYLLVTAGGFSELGEEGRVLEARLVDTVRTYGMRMVGPNANTNLWEAMPEPVNPRIGKIALVTQSGHMGRVIFQASGHGVAFSRWIPTGNEADLESADFIEYFAHDEETTVIAGYFEGFRDGAKLRKALAAAAAQRKPVVLIKVGRHQAATRMAETHSAHLTGSDAGFDGLFKQYGVVRVDDVDELIETAALFAKLSPAPSGPSVALYGISGGAVALMADQAETCGVAVPELATETQRRLHEVLPKHLGVGNPVDPGNLYRTGTAEQRRQVLEIIGEDPTASVVVCALTGVIKGITDDFVGDIVQFRDLGRKPVVTTWNTWEMETPAYTALVASGIPIFRSFRGCFRALRAYFEHQRRREITSARPAPPQAPPEALPAQPARTLDSREAAELLGHYGIPLAEERMVNAAAEATRAADELGLPVVLKAVPRDIAHKSDAGLVRLGLRSAGEVESAFDELRVRLRELSPAEAAMPLQLQRQLAAGVEVILGVTREPTLGPVLLVGLGGIFTEVLHDVSVRPLPVTPADAEEMLRELTGYPLLMGARGTPPANVKALIEMMLAVAGMAGDPSLRLVGLDLNPVIVDASGAVAVDRLVIVEGGPEGG